MNTTDQYIRVAHTDDIETGTMKCFKLGDRQILIANDNGEFYAVDEMCTHEEASLCTGSLREHYVKCPLHGSRFDLKTGKALDEPAEDPLRTYVVKLENSEIFVKLSLNFN